MLKFCVILLTLLGIAYPYLLWLVPLKHLALLFLAIAALWLLRAILERSIEYALWSALICCNFGFYFIFGQENWLYFYPLFINASLLLYFAYSLKGESLITKFARKRHKVLSTAVIAYTRGLTKIWCGFFAFNICVIGILVGLEDKLYWSVYCGIVTYILMGFLFGAEFLLRKTLLQRKEKLENAL